MDQDAKMKKLEERIQYLESENYMDFQVCQWRMLGITLMFLYTSFWVGQAGFFWSCFLFVLALAYGVPTAVYFTTNFVTVAVQRRKDVATAKELGRTVF